MRNLISFAVAASAIAAPLFAAEPRFELRDLGALTPGGWSWAYAISQNGMVAGDAAVDFGGRHAFLWDGHMRDLQNALAAEFRGDSIAYGVNSSGNVAGVVLAPGGQRGFVILNGAAQMFPTFSAAYAINDYNQVGGSRTLNLNQTPYIWASGSFTNLTGTGAVWALNRAGQAAGISGGSGHAVLWSGGNVVNLGAAGGFYPGLASQIYSLNDHGQAAGRAAPNWQAFLWDGAQYVALHNQNLSSSEALGINNAGLVVGTMSVSIWDTTASGFIYDGLRLYDLNTFIVQADGWKVIRGAAINDAGQIAAVGVRNGIPHALLLTPLESLAAPFLPTCTAPPPLLNRGGAPSCTSGGTTPPVTPPAPNPTPNPNPNPNPNPIPTPNPPPPQATCVQPGLPNRAGLPVCESSGSSGGSGSTPIDPTPPTTPDPTPLPGPAPTPPPPSACVAPGVPNRAGLPVCGN